MPCLTPPQPWVERAGAAGRETPSSCPSQSLCSWTGSPTQPWKTVSACRPNGPGALSDTCSPHLPEGSPCTCLRRPLGPPVPTTSSAP